MRALQIPLSLRNKLTLAFLLALAPVLGLLAYDYLDDYQKREQMVLEGQLRTAEAVGSALDATVDQAVSLGQALAVDPIVRSFSATQPSQLDPYLARYPRSYPRFQDVNVWDANGQNAGTSGTISAGQARPTIADREHFQRAMATGEPAISGLLIPRIGGPPSVAAAVPIKDEGGRTTGVVTVLLDLGELRSELRKVPQHGDEALFVADSSGTLAIHTLEVDAEWLGRDVSSYEPVREALSRGMYMGTEAGFLAAGPHLVAASQTPRFGWVVGSLEPVSSALQPVQSALRIKLAWYLGTVLLGVGLAVGLTFVIARPLDNLRQAIAALGRGELRRRAEVRTGDELEETAEAFNWMAEALEREQGRLRFLTETTTALVSALDANRVMGLLAERATEVLGEACLLYLREDGDEDGRRLVAAHAREPGILERLEALVEQHRRWIAANLSLPVMETREPILITDVGSSELEGELRRQLVEMHALSLMVVPLQARDRSLGVLACVAFSEERRFGDEDLALAVDLGGRAGLVMDNSLLFQQVQGERRRLETILQTVLVGVVVAGAPSGRVTLVNPMAEKLLGKRPTSSLIYSWPADYGLHRSNGELYPPGEDCLARALLRGETCAGEEMIVRRSSGESLYLLTHSAPIRDDEGRLVGAVAAFQDITAQKAAQRRMEQLVREAEERRSELDAVIEGVGEGITLVDGEGLVVRVNRVGREIWGVSAGEVEGLPMRELGERLELSYPDGRPVPPEEQPIVRAHRGELFRAVEGVYHRPDGRRFHLLFSSGNVRDEKGRVQMAMNVYADITPIREFERAREEFVSMVAHDLRSPLTVITAFAGMLRRIPQGQHGGPQEQRAVDSIISSARRLEKMVADLLDASRIEARRLKLEMEPVELTGLVQEVVDRSAELTSGHAVGVEMHELRLPVLADPARVEQVLVNLLSNAAKYSYPGSPIEVEAERRGTEAVVSVTNQGQGIPQAELGAIFERFRRTREAERGQVSGLGLGLYITRGLVEAMSGRIWVESEEGKYASFRFALPLAAAHEEKTGETAA